MFESSCRFSSKWRGNSQYLFPLVWDMCCVRKPRWLDSLSLINLITFSVRASVTVCILKRFKECPHNVLILKSLCSFDISQFKLFRINLQTINFQPTFILYFLRCLVDLCITHVYFLASLLKCWNTCAWFLVCSSFLFIMSENVSSTSYPASC